MKTIFTLCLVAALSMICHHNSSAQNSSIRFTTAPSTTSSASSQFVKIINFTVSVNNDKVLLNWAVEQNQDANQFEVEKSANGNDFTMAALVFGTDKKETTNYKFYEKANTGKTYYRVKVILNDGSIVYTPVIAPAVNQ
jgi:hypothetical protein